MTFACRTTRRRPAGRGLALLVLVVLAGLLGMHALSPAQGAVRQGGGGAVQAAGHHVQAAGHHAQNAGHHGHGAPTAHASTDSGETHGCSHGAGSSGHLEHADATCAAAGVSASYAPPALSPALVDAPAPSALAAVAPRSTAAGRAPPDLAELQLLRI
ncbi:DUF6153 family protein [Streptomyces tritici]|uniref:DUF6153 family protein n=1 Tax=Streptomyces tritici TaxID=2054410 RepID=UPI003AF1470C